MDHGAGDDHDDDDDDDYGDDDDADDDDDNGDEDEDEGGSRRMPFSLDNLAKDSRYRVTCAIRNAQAVSQPPPPPAQASKQLLRAPVMATCREMSHAQCVSFACIKHSEL